MKRIAKSKLIEFLKSKGELWVKTREGFQQSDAEAFAGRASKSVKNMVLPREETLLVFFKPDGKNVDYDEIYDDRKRILFGLSPCDAKSIELLDLTFIKTSPTDSYYKQRRENSVLVVLACNNPSKTCFCKSFGYGPFTELGDVFLVDIGDVYLVKILSDKGKALLEGLELEDAADAELAKLEELKSTAESKVQDIGIPKDIADRLYANFESDFWEKIAFRCVNCGACTFYCPTCYCFDIQDVERTNWGWRERTWDSCMFAIYSLETSGHNPRPTGMHRMRNRIMHKFSYYEKIHGQHLCVGCGRCVDVCPTGFDIREVVKQAAKLEVTR